MQVAAFVTHDVAIDHQARSTFPGVRGMGSHPTRNLKYLWKMNILWKYCSQRHHPISSPFPVRLHIANTAPARASILHIFYVIMGNRVSTTGSRTPSDSFSRYVASPMSDETRHRSWRSRSSSTPTTVAPPPSASSSAAQQQPQQQYQQPSARSPVPGTRAGGRAGSGSAGGRRSSRNDHDDGEYGEDVDDEHGIERPGDMSWYQMAKVCFVLFCFHCLEFLCHETRRGAESSPFVLSSFFRSSYASR